MSHFWRHAPSIGSPEAQELHRLFPPIDLHADTLMWAQAIGYDMGVRHEPPLPRSAWVGHVDLPRLADINAGAQFFSVATHPFPQRRLFDLACAQIDRFNEACSKYRRCIIPAREVGDVYRAQTEGATAGILSVEGAHFLEGRIKNLYRLAERGVRSFGLVHFTPNEAAFPNFGLWMCEDEGLSDFGRRLVHECAHLGIIVDLAHINLVGFMNVIATTRRPVIVSHTGIAGVYRHRRNIDDEQLRAVAETGGVVGVMYAPVFLGGKDVSAVIRHLSHAINVAGEEHVGLGSDYDGMIVPVRGLEHIGKLPNLTDAMLQAGWSYDRIGRILCRNVMRVLRDVRPAT